MGTCRATAYLGSELWTRGNRTLQVTSTGCETASSSDNLASSTPHHGSGIDFLNLTPFLETLASPVEANFTDPLLKRINELSCFCPPGFHLLYLCLWFKDTHFCLCANVAVIYRCGLTLDALKFGVHILRHCISLMAACRSLPFINDNHPFSTLRKIRVEREYCFIGII
jgi:hypothetical protein